MKFAESVKEFMEHPNQR